MGNLIVKIDVDGVLRDIFTPMCELYNHKCLENISVSDIHSYNVDETFSKLKELDIKNVSDFFFKDNSKTLFLDSKPYPYVQESLLRLKENGCKIVISTWQLNTDNKILTLKFLQENNIPYDDICFSKDKWIVKSDFIIDDNPEFITDEREKAKKILIDMPFNRSINRKDVVRVNNISDAVDIIISQNRHKYYL